MALYLRDVIEEHLSDTIKKIYDASYVRTILLDAAAEQYEKAEGRDISKFSPKRKSEKLWEWYSNMYSSEKTETSGSRAGSRTVSRATLEENYDFHTLYKKPSFEANLLGEIFPTAEFIQHICAALRMDCDCCNDLLQAYGYLPLHVKNLHNLAVYSVLSDIDTLGGNPLEAIRDRYFKAQYILKQHSGTAGIGTQAIDTALLTEKLNEYPDFNEERCLNYVQKNAVYLNWRHSALLKEHGRLVNVFQYLYDLYQKKPKNTDWSEAEGMHSLFSFVNCFCMKISHNNFGDRLIKDIRSDGESLERGNRHPTRETMILLWLYEEFFRNSPPILCPPKYAGAFRGEYCSDVRGAAGKDYGKTELNIHRLLFGTAPFRENKKIDYLGNSYPAEIHFDGAVSLKKIINQKLMAYSYALLDSNSKFDLLIMKFFKLKIYRAPLRMQNPSTGYYENFADYYCEFCGSSPIRLRDDPDFAHVVRFYEEYRIPLALSVFFAILEHVKSMGESISQDEIPNKQRRKFLLECSLSSQV